MRVKMPHESVLYICALFHESNSDQIKEHRMMGRVIFFFFGIPFYLRSVLVHSVNCVGYSGM
jgi:hypothetical protein